MSSVLKSRFSNLGFDPDALREKYRTERDKRLREEGNDQYVEVTGEFAHFVEDPYVERTEQEPLTDLVQVLIIGGGFGGLLAGARFREAGIDDIRIVEAGGDFGGTWYWNRYPGAQCDIESYCYLPLLEELGYMPKEKYSYAPEIYEHSQRIAQHFKLYDAACFQTSVTELRWDEDAANWIASTDRGDRMRARFVVMATGPLNRPKLPAIPGIEGFEGHTFHTSRWDYEYTGGNHSGGLTKLTDKRVAVIGTGATAIQAVPYVGEYARQLYVFQRTPSSVDLRGNKPTDFTWAESLSPARCCFRERRPGEGRGQASVACPTSSTRTQRRSRSDSRIASTTCPMRWPNAKSGSAGRPAASAQSRSCTSIAFWSL
jgi:cyclohexanone monooxygenase